MVHWAPLDYKKEERHALAIKSREAAPRFGTPERQKLIDEIHEYMLSKSPPAPESLPRTPEEQSTKEDKGEEQGSPPSTENPPPAAEEPANAGGDGIVPEMQEAPANPGASSRPPPAFQAEARQAPAANSSRQLLQKPATRVQKPPADDRLFTWAAVGLTIAIVFLLLKKFAKSSGHGAVFMNES
ncbi:Ubiquitin-conjugating enzyme E2 32 [Ancistrocladus abbreviatus]